MCSVGIGEPYFTLGTHALDLTLDPRFATLLGYTQTELEFYFADRLDQLAQRLLLRCITWSIGLPKFRG